MHEWDDEFYHEPTEFEMKIEELKDSLLNSVKDEYKQQLNRLAEENNRLTLIEREMKEKTRQLDNELRDIKFRKDNLKSEVEREFYESTMGDLLNKYSEQSLVWYAERTGHEQQKCQLCNDERNQIVNFPDGEKQSKRCKCATLVYKYEPAISEITTLMVRKRDSRYRSDRSFYMHRTYKRNPSDTYDYDGSDFKIQHIVDEFAEETKELHEKRSYGERVAFTTEEECQKYCDWLNAKERI